MTSLFRILTGTSSLAALLACAVAPGIAATRTAAQPADRAQRGVASFGAAHAIAPFASDGLNRFVATHRAIVPAVRGTFLATSTPKKPSANWIIGSSQYGGNIDIIDGNDGTVLATCAACGGWGVAVNKKNRDLAVVTESNTISVYHKQSTAPYFVQYATLTPQTISGWYGGAIAYDAEGGSTPATPSSVRRASIPTS